MKATLYDPEDEFREPKEVEVHQSGVGDIVIRVEGHGTFDMCNGPVVNLEWYNGKLNLIVWPDVNSDEPVTIELNNSHQSLLAEECVEHQLPI